MVAFFLYMSFFIHALTLAGLYVVFQHVQKIKNTKPKEIDSMMQSYLEKIQQENKALQAALQDTAPHTETINTKKRVADHDHDRDMTTDRSGQHQVNTSLTWKPESIISSNEDDTLETSLASRVLQLDRAGVNIEDIAKQLHCGTTEVALIIQFQKEIKLNNCQKTKHVL